MVAAYISFDFSCASFDVLTNDERTRSFLVCEVGYGHDHVSLHNSSYSASAECLSLTCLIPAGIAYRGL